MSAQAPRRQGLWSLLRLFLWSTIGACAFVVAIIVFLVASCEDNVPPHTSLPTAAGYRAEGDELILWTGAPCQGVTKVAVNFRMWVTESPTKPNYAYYDVSLTADSPGVRIDHLNLVDPGPDFTRKGELPDGFDWRSAASITVRITADGPTWTSRVSVAEIVAGSPEHPDDTYLFDDLGWKGPAQVERENGTDFIAICTSDPADS